MRLRVSIGSCKDDLQTAWVNVDDKPTEINSKYWIGRVLVRVKDFDGYTPDGSPPATESEYFEGRNRRFHIQAEGRFKKEYNGDEVWFGTQFDHMIANFPETLFNAGMRIAKYIDPAVFYDKSSHTPYIMSPYLACVNTLSAWPAPHRSQDAVLALENGNAINDSDEEESNDVPREEVQHNKHGAPPKPIRYWSFQGFREDETSNTLQRKPTRESLLLEDRMHTVDEDGHREGSILTQSTRYDGDRMVTAENPSHRLALTRLGSYGRETNVVRSSLPAAGGTTLDAFPEDVSDEDDRDGDADSFYTAAEYIFENEVLPDGTIVPVKKKKSGLSVKKVRKSLHIPSAKTIEKNMRGLSIKRKDKAEKRVDSMGSDNDRVDAGRNSSEPAPTRKSIDLMRPFRFGHHEKDNSTNNSRKSAQLERERNTRSPQLPKSRTSISEDRDFNSTPQSVNTPRISATIQPVAQETVRTENRAENPSYVERSVQPALAAASSPIFTSPIPFDTGRDDRTLQSLRTESTLTSSTYEPPQGALQSQQSIEGVSGSSPPVDHASFASLKGTAHTGTIEAKQRVQASETTTAQAAYEDDGISHKLDTELGPWRFNDPQVEPLEDTAFIFGDTSHSVKDRRKHFAKSEANRKEFEFDPDIVYCMSFFLPYMNFNTFDLKLGPLGANLHKYVNDQPVRYMARSATRPEEVFFMVEFSLE